MEIPPTSERRRVLPVVTLAAGPTAALIMFMITPASMPDGNGGLIFLGTSGKITLSLLFWMAIWWTTEAVPLYITGLLPITLLPLSGATTMAETSVHYGHPIIFLVIGGSMLALAIEKWKLHIRLASAVFNLFGSSPRAVIGGIMAVTAFLSMWLTNTAAVMVMLPIAIGLVGSADKASLFHENFVRCLMIGIAYSSTVGGLASMTGSGMNMFVVSYLQNNFAFEISFLTWMAIGLPFCVIFLTFIWVYLSFILWPTGKGVVLDQDVNQGNDKNWTLGATLTSCIFVLTATAWMARPYLNESRLFENLDDAVIAVCAALLLFSIPLSFKNKKFLLDWSDAKRVPWGLILLIGGGLALASAIEDFGVGSLIGSSLNYLGGLHVTLILVAIVVIAVFLTEIVSGIAAVAFLLPILASAAAHLLNLPPEELVLTITFAAGCAFMLPTATPPNSLVFATGLVPVRSMVKAGLLVNIVGIALISLILPPLIRYALSL